MAFPVRALRRWLAVLAFPLVAGLFPHAAEASSSSSWTYVPVLMYHYIRVNPDPRDRVGYSLSVTPSAFHAQMAYLARNNFHTLTLAQAAAAIRNHQALPSRSVVLTFDDGYADFYTTAVPEMRRYGFTATDYVVPGLIGRGSFMTWSQVIAADRMGFTVAAHTVHHVALARTRWSTALWEMAESKRQLEAVLGHPVNEFAYPYGSFNGYLAWQARAMGFESAASTIPGAWHQSGELYWLHRQRVSGWTSLSSFAQLVGGPWPGAPARPEATSPPAASSPPATAQPAPKPKPTAPGPMRRKSPSPAAWAVATHPRPTRPVAWSAPAGASHPTRLAPRK